MRLIISCIFADEFSLKKPPEIQCFLPICIYFLSLYSPAALLTINVPLILQMQSLLDFLLFPAIFNAHRKRFTAIVMESSLKRFFEHPKSHPIQEDVAGSLKVLTETGSCLCPLPYTHNALNFMKRLLLMHLSSVREFFECA
jgi:hypothetical protein